ncbi:preprotein translocase subunit SecE [Candidatus Saccharibacteria bacterium 47-87]|nr:preprotein translocase subunit SecE [Candidatus Saccharibacteria bacterium]OJU96989.1 MAG: preprotein translocase subunit SecE [Candidatus Saccharibacteria bacterium 47-87]
MAKTTKVTRISAKSKRVEKKPKEHKKSFLGGIGRYFKGAWVELRQVRWPNRRATWALTLAVILFSVFFGVLISLLDTLFKYLFELIIA